MRHTAQTGTASYFIEKLSTMLTGPKTVTFGTRTGQNSPEKAYNGTSDRHYYMTPVEFFGTSLILCVVVGRPTCYHHLT